MKLSVVVVISLDVKINIITPSLKIPPPANLGNPFSLHFLGGQKQ
jgi:hypothetical protein